MTRPHVLRLADGSGTADLAGYLVRLLRYDRAAAVHLRADGTVLATFGHVPFGTGASSGVLAVRTSALAEPARVEETVSAGQLLDVLARSEGGAESAAASAAASSAAAAAADQPTQRGGGGGGGGPAASGRDVGPGLTLPAPVTGPPWTGLLPPRSGWALAASLPVPDLVHEVADAVGRFRARSEALPPAERTRPALDRIAGDVWAHPLPGTDLPLRAAHAAASLGFLGSVDAGTAAHVHTVGGWLRLDGPFGSVFVRRAGGSSLFIPRR